MTARKVLEAIGAFMGTEVPGHPVLGPILGALGGLGCGLYYGI